MANIIQISPVTPLKWYRQSDVWNALETSANAQFGVFNPLYNSKHFDIDFWERNLSRWMDKVTYFQPWQTNDIVKEQFLGVEDVGGVEYVVRLCTCEGKIVKQVNATAGVQVGSDDMYIWEYNFSLYDIPEGKYFFQIWYNPAVPGADYFLISAPIEVKKYHEGTQLWKYYNTYNDQDVYYETGIQFYIRVHSQLMDFQPDAERNVYKDQPLNLELLSGISFRIWELVIGGMNYSVPDVYLDKYNRILNSDKLYIDGKEYTTTEGAKLGIDRIRNHPLYEARISVQEKDNSPLLIIDEFAEIECCDTPVSEWFYVDSYNINVFGVTNYIRKKFNGLSEFLGYLNTVIFYQLPEGTYFAANKNGKIVIRTNNVLYSNLLQGFTINGILQSWIQCEVAGGDFELYVQSSVPFNWAFDNGDGVMTMTTGATTATAFGSYVIPEYCYFFCDDAENFDFTVTTFGTIQSVNGQLPASCISFYAPSIGIGAIKGNLFLTCNGALSEINLRDGVITSLNVNQVIIWLYEAYLKGALNLSGIGIEIDNQAPAAAPAPDSGVQMMIAALRTAGFNVTTD